MKILYFSLMQYEEFINNVEKSFSKYKNPSDSILEIRRRTLHYLPKSPSTLGWEQGEVVHSGLGV